MAFQKEDFVQLRNEIDAFIHIMEALAKCQQNAKVPIDPKAVDRLAGMLTRYLSQAVAKLYCVDGT
jgi:hypothetical protein